jgi:hypothetical protein
MKGQQKNPVDNRYGIFLLQAGLLQNIPQPVDDTADTAGEDPQREIDPQVVGNLAAIFQINGQRRDHNCQNNHQYFIAAIHKTLSLINLGEFNYQTILYNIYPNI